MKKFNESMFAFACTQEVIQISPWWAQNIPIIPSLQMEAKVGYDVRFDLPGTFLLYQFKLTSRVENLRLVGDEQVDSPETQRLRILARRGLHQFWTTPHQHQRLSRLCGFFPFTYYVAPKFSSNKELNDYFKRKKVLDNSLIVPVINCPGPRGDNGHRHRIIAPINSSEVFIFSEHKAIENLNFKLFLKSIWEKWLKNEPLYRTIDFIWNEFPGIRGRTKRLFSDYEQAQLFLTAGESEFESRQQIDTISSPSRRRIPPWPKEEIFRSPFRESTEEYNIKLAVIAEIFSANGLKLGLIQPKDRYVD